MLRQACSRHRHTGLQLVALSVAALSLATACATPVEHVRSMAVEHGLSHELRRGDDFEHLLIAGNAPDAWREHGPPLTIYVDHDGRPWVGGTRVARDPSPRDPLALRLMLRALEHPRAAGLGAGTQDAPALYVGRPCHFGAGPADACHPLLWTHARYADAVVASMATAIEDWIAARGGTVSARQPAVVLVGYSGGGTLAVLLAARLPRTIAVVTIAANLDVAAWAGHHRYSPLAGSLDPARQPPLPPAVAQWHFVGARDEVVPGALQAGYLRRNPGARQIEVQDQDHVCCWRSLWPALLPVP